jgi:hypothetical protein
MSPVSGWTVSNVHYQLANDPSTLAGVEFDLDGPTGVVRASVDSSGARFFDCRNTGAYHWVCDINSSIQVSELDELRVVATGG